MRGEKVRATLGVLLLAALACNEPLPSAVAAAPGPAPVEPSDRGRLPVADAGAVTASTAVEPDAPQPDKPDAGAAAPPEPLACEPRPAHAPVDYVTFDAGFAAGSRSADAQAPRLSTPDPRLAPSLLAVQEAVHGWVERGVGELRGLSGAACGARCSAEVRCEAQRNDGQFLSFHCSNAYSVDSGHGLQGGVGGSDTVHAAFNYRRQGDRFEATDLRAIGRDGASPLGHVDVAAVGGSLGCWGLVDGPVVLLDGALRLQAASAGLSVGSAASCDLPYAALAPWLACGALFDPSPAWTSLPTAPPPLAFATWHGGQDDGAAWGLLPQREVDYPRFTSADPRRSPAADTLNRELRAWVDDQLTSASWSEVRLRCTVASSTSLLVSTLCYVDGWTAGAPKVAAVAFNHRLVPPLARLAVDEVIRGRPALLSEIARTCLGPWVHAPKNEYDEVVASLPQLQTADLGAYGLMGDGVMFYVPFVTTQRPRLQSCFIPYSRLGTNLAALSAAP